MAKTFKETLEDNGVDIPPIPGTETAEHPNGTILSHWDNLTGTMVRYPARASFIVKISRWNNSPRIIYKGKTFAKAIETYNSIMVYLNDKKTLSFIPIGEKDSVSMLSLKGTIQKPYDLRGRYDRPEIEYKYIQKSHKIPAALFDEFKSKTNVTAKMDKHVSLTTSLKYLMIYFCSLSDQERLKFFDDRHELYDSYKEKSMKKLYTPAKRKKDKENEDQEEQEEESSQNKQDIAELL